MNARADVDRPATWGRDLTRVPTRLLLGVIAVYRLLLSPMFAGSCRYVPSCSAYATEALDRHGAVLGAWLTLRRLARCHPFSRGGLDQVPLSRDRR